MKPYHRNYRIIITGVITAVLLTAGHSQCAPNDKGVKTVKTGNMNDPSRFEIISHLWLSKTFLRPFYRSYVRSMNLSGDEMVLDFGSGSASLAVHIAEKLSRGGRVTCLDISEKWLDSARKRLKSRRNADFLLGDITAMDIPDGSYDIVVIHFVLHDIPGELRSGILQKIARILKNGGKLYIREPVRESHGMPAIEIKRLMSGASLKEVKGEFQKKFYTGPMFSAVYTK